MLKSMAVRVWEKWLSDDVSNKRSIEPVHFPENTVTTEQKEPRQDNVTLWRKWCRCSRLLVLVEHRKEKLQNWKRYFSLPFNSFVLNA